MRERIAKCLDAVGFWLLDLSERICPIEPRSLAVPPWNPWDDDNGR